MLRVLEGEPGVVGHWLRFGGADTLLSYGIDPDEIARMSESDALGRIQTKVPSEHRAFLKSFADSISFGNYLFVHAGIRPGIDLAKQSSTDLRWIRDPFLNDDRDHGFVVVHGHTICNSVEVTPNRVGIDTGAYCTDVLTALGIEGDKRWLIQTSGDGTERFPLD